MRVVFLDFDGVLHPAGEPPGTSLPFEWTEVLAALLKPFDDVRIVIHSSWREHFPAQELRDFLEAVGDRLIGVVDAGPKGPAIERFLSEHPEITDALVLDDQVDEFRSGFPAALLACEPRTGLSSEEVQHHLRCWLLGRGLDASTAPTAEVGRHRVMVPSQRGQRSFRRSVAAPPIADFLGARKLIDVQLELTVGGTVSTIAGGIWNAAALGTRSDYGFTFEGRESQKDVRLRQYPRWCEPVSGLIARCLALTTSQGTDALSSSWERIELRIALVSAARGYELLDTVGAERDGSGGLNVVKVAPSGWSLVMNRIKPRATYGDPWDVAEHALRLTTFEGEDELPAPKELDVPVRRDGDLSFICTRDIPEPARSVFEERMQHSTRPVVPGYFDAVYVWDWMDFLGGNR